MPEPTRADTVRFDLDSRLLACRGAANAAELASDLDQIRRIASAAGLFPAVTVAHALEAALARGERGPMILGWLDILSDAIGSGACDARAAETYAAACSVRYG